jgi:para-aminobenzoate synthetase/4-amino-4-deoxychorismate lyase
VIHTGVDYNDNTWDAERPDINAWTHIAHHDLIRGLSIDKTLLCEVEPANTRARACTRRIDMLTAVSPAPLDPPLPRALVHDPDTGEWLLLEDPAWILTTNAVGEVRRLLDDGLAREKTAATLCCLAYEASPAFDGSLRVKQPGSLPLLWMAGFRTRTQMTAARWLTECDAGGSEVLLGPWQPEMTDAAYARAFAAVKSHLAAGNAYQINLTQRYRTRLLAPPTHAGLRQLFLRLIQRHPSPHAAFLDTGDFALLSLSPETFFARDHPQVRCRPMKGTAARGNTAAADRLAAQRLRDSAKEQAENRMIVDMVRNDLGRVARVGSVRVPALFRIEHYATVHQMISEVTAETQVPDATLLAALFPSASITGAPKVAATAIIAALESSPRGFYTGSLGTRFDDGRSFWSVAIRTLVIDRRLGIAEYGSGGGIVWDSEADRELAELRLKARVLADTAPGFDLLETMRLEPDGEVFLLDRHLRRLSESARVFGFIYDQAKVLDCIQEAINASPPCQPPEPPEPPEPRILRLVLSANGAVSIRITALSARPMPTPLRVRLADRAVDSRDIRLRHKTTDRRVYHAAAGRLPDPGEEVFMFNERNELTEGSFTNILLELDGGCYTPPATAGLLPGCYRAELLATGRIRERRLSLADLERATSVWAMNSVRGLMPVVLPVVFPGASHQGQAAAAEALSHCRPPI